MRPRCTSRGPDGSTSNHCTADRVAVVAGRKIVCVHQILPLRRTQFCKRLSPASIFTVESSCGAKSSPLAPLSAQPSANGVSPAFPPAKDSDPGWPCSLLRRTAGRVPPNVCTKYIVSGRLSASCAGTNSPLLSLKVEWLPVPPRYRSALLKTHSEVPW